MVKIHELEIENVKRIRAVRLEPAENGLTVIGGGNNQGKTSVLDAIAWALGGERFRPTKAAREGAVVPPYLHVTLSNGLIVERKGKNSDLKVTDPAGHRGGQQLLNEFVEQMALDLPRFLRATDREKADILLKALGIGDQLAELERVEQNLYNERHAIGQIADRKAKYAQEQVSWPDAPAELQSVGELVRQQQEILMQNNENRRNRDRAERLAQEVEGCRSYVTELSARLREAETRLAETCAALSDARKAAAAQQDRPTEELERRMAEIETVNAQVRDNQNKARAEAEARACKQQYDNLTAELETVRGQKAALLRNACLPLEGLFVENGTLTYQGQKWDNMSGSDQLRVATAIVRCLKPDCGFVLLDQLEQMDLKTLREFGTWLEQEGLQAIATRVSTGDECAILISDGAVQPQEAVK